MNKRLRAYAASQIRLNEHLTPLLIPQLHRRISTLEEDMSQLSIINIILISQSVIIVVYLYMANVRSLLYLISNSYVLSYTV